MTLEVNQTSGEFRKIRPRPLNLMEIKSFSIPEIKSHFSSVIFSESHGP